MKNKHFSCAKNLFFGNEKTLNKFFYILRGCVSSPGLFLLFLNIYWVNNAEVSFKQCVIKLLILWSRIGALKSNSNICLDEGCAQALWGWFNTYPINDENIIFLKKALLLINVDWNVFYVYTAKENYINRSSLRKRKHLFNSFSGYQRERSRNWMVILLSLLNKVDVKVCSLKN